MHGPRWGGALSSGWMGMTMMACASPTLVPAMCLTPAYIDDITSRASAMCCKCGGGSTAAPAGQGQGQGQG